MLIVIPTYKRNDCLKWVLQSLVQCHIESIPEQIRVVVVNNYPPAAQEITNIVDHFSKDERFSWEVLYREKTLLPVDNWYSAIFAKALENEVVFINSDDDLFMPNSLQIRYHEICRNDGDLILSQLGPTVYFYQKCEHLLCLRELEKSPKTEATAIGFSDLYLYDPQHLSNHCYRNTLRLRNFFDKAMAWCDELFWLDRHNRIINFPLILTFAICYQEGRIYGLSTPLILRGQEVEELISAKYGVPGWNHGFIHLSGFMIMNNRDLERVKGLDHWREIYRATYIKWFPTYLFDRRLKWSMVKDMQCRSGLKWHSLFSKYLLSGLFLVLLDWTCLRGRRLERKARKESVETSFFMQKLTTL